LKCKVVFATPKQAERKSVAGTRKRTPPNQSLDRGLIILETVARSRRPVAIAEFTEVFDVDHSSVFRLTNTLKNRGFLVCPKGRKDYILGPSVWRLARQYDWGNMLVMLGHEHLERLAGETGETAHLAVREGRHALMVDHVTGNHAIVVSGRTGESIPVHCTAHGKALLADFDKPQLEALFGDTPLRSNTSEAIVSLDRLAEACAQIRAQGFAIDDEEFHEGIRCVAAPIRDKDSAVIGSIGISAPCTRFPEQRYRICGDQTLKVAERISGVLASKA
jgi:IclR family transcriptional regulator, acetate operon repressor